MATLGLFLAVLVGISLGLIGSGGSILTVPILVYIVGIEPVVATAYSLFIVGSTALVGGLQNARQGKVDFKTAIIFGIPSIVSIYFIRLYVMPLIPQELLHIGHFALSKNMGLMVFFAFFMMLASTFMIRPSKQTPDENSQVNITPKDYPFILLRGLGVGTLAGLVGAGGGFLIIPALVLLAKMPMKRAIGTSLFIIAAQSLLGFLGDLQRNPDIQWPLLLGFSAASVSGIFVGNYLGKFISGAKLKTSFGWFVLVMGLYIVSREIIGQL
ncbi:hypothetical protein SAMN05421780_101441 [Flexibacter flexilis DSM 6793]|uniref:Probable membrane transporter protein n=1 Tax=Flexibacter flexilis DSM 6793 TaxID=927664 RepID=A0A1I1DU46_9BACT|nr:sulfite exporter TauE/SafE family protein [Flexibacter flexilis]SFB77926.1 hypothetical protein SAMN05421780_101441 [Flexibacter flexilis DSM 6793]